jgi:excinuclease ABC subunit A
MADVEKLIAVFHKLVEAGNTVLVIEHNLDIIAAADYIIDLGPEGGEKGGRVIACGPPAEIIKCENSYTGQWLKRAILNTPPGQKKNIAR